MLISSLSERISKLGVSRWEQTKYTQECGRTSILWTLDPDAQARDAVPSAYITSVGDGTNPHTLEDCVRGDHDYDSLPDLVAEAKSTGVRRVTFEVPYYYQPKYGMKVRQQVELNLTRSGGWTMAAVGYGENNTQVFGSYANTDRMGVYKDLVDEFSFQAEVKLDALHFAETTLPCNGELKHPKSPLLEGTLRASPKAWNSWQVIHLGYCPLCIAEVKSDPKAVEPSSLQQAARSGRKTTTITPRRNGKTSPTSTSTPGGQTPSTGSTSRSDNTGSRLTSGSTQETASPPKAEDLRHRRSVVTSLLSGRLPPPSPALLQERQSGVSSPVDFDETLEGVTVSRFQQGKSWNPRVGRR